jgi:hypothetical protein
MHMKVAQKKTVLTNTDMHANIRASMCMYVWTEQQQQRNQYICTYMHTAAECTYTNTYIHTAAENKEKQNSARKKSDERASMDNAFMQRNETDTSSTQRKSRSVST